MPESERDTITPTQIVSVSAGVRQRKGGAKNVCLRFFDGHVKTLVARSPAEAEGWRTRILEVMRSLNTSPPTNVDMVVTY